MFHDHNFEAEFELQVSYQSGMNRQRTISLVAWDLDNTLFDREAALARFFAEWLRERFPGQTAAALAVMLEGIQRADRFGDANRIGFCASALATCGLPEHGAPCLWQEIQERLPDFIRPEPGVLALLRWLAPRVRMIVVSNGGGAFQRTKAWRAGLEEWFPPESIFISGEIGAEKPSPKIFNTVLSSTGARAESVLFVGDHVVNDIHGAAAAGMRTCWVSRGREIPPSLAADFIVREASDLKLLPLIFEAAPAIL
jgi:putative hydrolase of the HAD superfamily